MSTESNTDKRAFTKQFFELSNTARLYIFYLIKQSKCYILNGLCFWILWKLKTPVFFILEMALVTHFYSKMWRISNNKKNIRNVLHCEKWRTKPCLNEFSNYCLHWDDSIARTHCKVQAVQRNGLLRQQLHWRVGIDGDWSAAHCKTQSTFNQTRWEFRRIVQWCLKGLSIVGQAWPLLDELQLKESVSQIWLWITF